MAVPAIPRYFFTILKALDVRAEVSSRYSRFASSGMPSAEWHPLLPGRFHALVWQIHAVRVPSRLRHVCNCAVTSLCFCQSELFAAQVGGDSFSMTVVAIETGCASRCKSADCGGEAEHLRGIA